MIPPFVRSSSSILCCWPVRSIHSLLQSHLHISRPHRHHRLPPCLSDPQSPQSAPINYSESVLFPSFCRRIIIVTTSACPTYCVHQSSLFGVFGCSGCSWWAAAANYIALVVSFVYDRLCYRVDTPPSFDHRPLTTIVIEPIDVQLSESSASSLSSLF